MIIEFDGFSDYKFYISASHISAVTRNEGGKGAKIFIDSSETPFYVVEDVETVVRKIRDTMLQSQEES
jgi:hypothetical protein